MKEVRNGIELSFAWISDILIPIFYNGTSGGTLLVGSLKFCEENECCSKPEDSSKEGASN